MKGVICAGGTGSRLMPLTTVTSKHLLPVGRKPMIYHPVERIVGAGIREILVVTGTEHAGAVFQLLGSGASFGCEFTFRVQDQAGGIAEALGLARSFVGNEPFCVVLGDNIFTADLTPFVAEFAPGPESPRGMVLLHPTGTPERFGVAVVEGGRIREIIEKPPAPAPSDLAVVGVYFYQGQGIFGIIAGLKRSARGELEITDLHNELLRQGRLRHGILPGPWSDAGTFETLAKAGEIVGS